MMYTISILATSIANAHYGVSADSTPSTANSGSGLMSIIIIIGIIVLSCYIASLILKPFFEGFKNKSGRMSAEASQRNAETAEKRLNFEIESKKFEQDLKLKELELKINSLAAQEAFNAASLEIQRSKMDIEASDRKAALAETSRHNGAQEDLQKREASSQISVNFQKEIEISLKNIKEGESLGIDMSATRTHVQNRVNSLL